MVFVSPKNETALFEYKKGYMLEDKEDLWEVNLLHFSLI